MALKKVHKALKFKIGNLNWCSWYITYMVLSFCFKDLLQTKQNKFNFSALSALGKTLQWSDWHKVNEIGAMGMF